MDGGGGGGGGGGGPLFTRGPDLQCWNQQQQVETKLNAGKSQTVNSFHCDSQNESNTESTRAGGRKRFSCSSDHMHNESSSDSDISDSRLVTFTFPRQE